MIVSSQDNLNIVSIASQVELRAIQYVLEQAPVETIVAAQRALEVLGFELDEVDVESIVFQYALALRNALKKYSLPEAKESTAHRADESGPKAPPGGWVN